MREKNNYGSVTAYINELEQENEKLRDKLAKAISFLELQEKHLPDGIVFFWREAVY